MKTTEIIIKNKLSYNLTLSIVGIGFILLGAFFLWTPHEINKEGMPYWLLGAFFISLGLIAIFQLLAFLELKIRTDELEIVSLFRKRIIHKADVLGYRVENYSGEYISGERIRLFCKKGSFKFHTSQFESIDKIKKFVKGKEVRTEASTRKIENIAVILFCILILTGIVLYPKFNPSEEGETQAIGIPANFLDDINIVEEKEGQIKFKLEEYQGYLFVVDTNDIPHNMKTTQKELVVFIEDKNNAQELLNINPQRNNNQTTKLIPVDKITVLE